MFARSSGGWVQAKHALERVLAAHGAVEIGYVRKIGEGLSYEVYAAHVGVQPDEGGRSGEYTVHLPIPRAALRPNLSPSTEIALLDRVAAQIEPLRLPTVIGVASVGGTEAVVRSYVDGTPLNLRGGREPAVRPWEIVGQVAAAIHGVDVTGLRGLAGHATWRQHALAEIAVLGGLPELREAEAWALANLPPDEPSVLLHGDLLGQNILLHPSEPPAIIDWKSATLGDPAYDLSIVTRGVRKPFKVTNGMECLIDAYNRAVRPPRRKAITASAVHLHELCLAGRWYRRSLDGPDGRFPPEQELQRLGGVLERACAATAGEQASEAGPP